MQRLTKHLSLDEPDSHCGDVCKQERYPDRLIAQNEIESEVQARKLTSPDFLLGEIVYPEMQIQTWSFPLPFGT